MGRRCNGGLGCAAFFAVLCALPGSVVTAQARPRADSLRAAAARLAPRTPVRLGLRTGNVLTGRLTGVDGAGLRLEGRAAAVPLDAVNHLSARGRSTGTGLKVGLIAGGIGGTIGGGLIGLVVAALCETDSCASTGTNVLVGAGLGLLAGGGGGAALGAVVGSTIPRWVEPGAAAPARIGELAATGAWSRLGSRAGGSGLGGDLSYMATFGPVAVGPDVGWHGLGTNLRQGFVRCQPPVRSPSGAVPDTVTFCPEQVPVGESVWHVGGAAQLDPLHADLRPYAVGGLGLYAWRSDYFGTSLDLLGYSVGGGLRWQPRRSAVGVRAEARWDSNLSRSGGTDHPLGYLTVGFGGTLRW